ncbi:MAG: hypothetical protein KDD76_03080 [Rickettsiales bacterium]|nr:hypothetical protein [Rickettsiales bacterium]
MHNIHYRFFLFLMAILLTGVAQSALAYECRFPATIKEIMRDADAVFTGKVTKITKGKPLSKENGGLGTPVQDITFAIDHIWKGLEKKPESIRVRTETFYDYHFKKGERYLVNAYQIYSPDTTLAIVGCPRVRTVQEAAQDILRLGPVMRPAPPDENLTTEKAATTEKTTNETTTPAPVTKKVSKGPMSKEEEDQLMIQQLLLDKGITPE